MANSKPSALRGVFSLIVIGVIIAIAINAAHKNNNTANTSTGTNATGAVTSGGMARIGQVAKDGNFAFVVKGMQCGHAISIEVGGVPAGATECLLTMTVNADKGTGEQFFASNQYAYDASGRKYQADDNALFNMSDTGDMSTINPGLSITALVPFQVPVGDKLAKVELHDSMFSEGVNVGL